ncbi:Tubulin beta chain [Pestalotiopsis fici W106-1]|uniref:Tubulin beta chain n=1 Tax=Pestalotiopsis fici (strain W106-1 / CGMCC3.15140) TaxID=1229662 RepID=W3XBE5_PESFW|nr:Tubulin beta chain [Pestalotiopsis fici W106-1]ETS83408.1 Tubulin beta chain [Pestalotiopsis fici W106-1]
MVREIIHLSVGQCGNQIGSAFWETIAREHGLDQSGHYSGIDTNQHEKIDVYFQEHQDSNYTPRAILVDQDPDIFNAVCSGYGQMFRQDNILSGKYNAGGTWFTEWHDEDAKLVEQVLENVRREAENCDCFQGFQLTHSVAGGAGGGMGTILLSKLREEYPDRMMATFSTMPSLKVSQGLVEPYNAVLAISQLIENCDVVFCLDNEALYDICTERLKIAQPAYANLNHLASMVMSDISASFRFPGQRNSDLRKMAMNLVTIPRLHFLSVAYAPLTNRQPDVGSSHKLTASGLIQQMFKPKNLMTACDVGNRHYLACSAIFRGRVPIQEIEDHVRFIRDDNSECSMERIPDNLQTSYCSQATQGLDLSGTLIENSTAIQHVFQRLSKEFTWLLCRKQYLFPYEMRGLYEFEFTEAVSNMDDLVLDYQLYNAQSL